MDFISGFRHLKDCGKGRRSVYSLGVGKNKDITSINTESLLLVSSVLLVSASYVSEPTISNFHAYFYLVLITI